VVSFTPWERAPGTHWIGGKLDEAPVLPHEEVRTKFQLYE